MITQAWPPGTLAVATVRGVEGVRVFRPADGWWITVEAGTGSYQRRDHHHPDEFVTDVRPLIVLDLSEDEARRLAAVLRTVDIEGFFTDRESTLVCKAADQIEAQTKPPKPPEPQGLGAVVEDTEGRKWVRFTRSGHYRWRNEQGERRTYDEIDVARKLSDGVA